MIIDYFYLIVTNSMRNQVFILCSALFLFAGHHDAHAQSFLKKLGKRLEQKIENTVEGKISRTVKGTGQWRCR